ncbi:hypothetical protein QTJ16_002195 [Diplocarpon rosae]|uniref:Uncharacterized protein n=1 Tax=Diplocarpon rosae TaxID=946125 RepID=A0AAD9T5E5_9HELO|nr:hypothetical protein QTJ16_002195 [Diplocarpon rosae]
MAASFSATARDFLDVETVNARIQSQLERKNGPATIQYLLMEIRSALEVIGKQQSELEALRKTPSMLAEVPDDLKKAALTARANWDISLGEFGRAYELIRTRSGALQDVMPGLDKKELDAAIAEVEDVITNIGFKNVAIVVTQKHIQERLLVDCKLFKDRALLAEAQLEDLEQKYNDQLLQNQVASEVANEMAVGLANERAVLQTKVADLQSRITAIPEIGEIVSEVENEFQSTTNLLTEGEDAKDSIDKLVRVVEELSEEANHTQRLAVELRNALDFFKTSYPECADKTKNLESIWQEIERTASNLVSLAQIWTADALDILDIHRGMKPFLAAADDATGKKQLDFAEYESQQWSARSRADRDNTLILDEDCEREKSDLQTKIKRLKNGLRMSAQEENARIQATLAQANADCDAKNQALRDQIDRLTKDLTTARDRTAIDAKIKDLERKPGECDRHGPDGPGTF